MLTAMRQKLLRRITRIHHSRIDKDRRFEYSARYARLLSAVFAHTIIDHCAATFLAGIPDYYA
jgi:hypothetical protein